MRFALAVAAGGALAVTLGCGPDPASPSAADITLASSSAMAASLVFNQMSGGEGACRRQSLAATSSASWMRV